MTAMAFWKKLLPDSSVDFLRTARPQKVKNMLTCWPMAAAPVAMTNAASTRSRSPEKTIRETRSSGARSSRAARRCSSARTLSSSVGCGMLCGIDEGSMACSSLRGALHEMDVDAGAIHRLRLLPHQLDVFRHLRPPLEVGDGAAVGRQHFEDLPRLEVADFLARADQRHGAVQPAGIQDSIEDLAHRSPPPRHRTPGTARTRSCPARAS